jgi:hypothetical protein
MTLFAVRARFSFPGLTRPLPETALAMDAWARAAADILAPELRWQVYVDEDEDLGDDDHWGTRHVLRIEGETKEEGALCGEGEARLAAGGDSKKVGGNGLIELQAVGPYRYLLADNHCDVTHWDIDAAALTEAQFDRLKRALEDVLGQQCEVGGERRDPIERGAQLLVKEASADDIAVWMEDLTSVGVDCRGHGNGNSLALFLESRSATSKRCAKRASCWARSSARWATKTGTNARADCSVISEPRAHSVSGISGSR